MGKIYTQYLGLNCSTLNERFPFARNGNKERISLLPFFFLFIVLSLSVFSGKSLTGQNVSHTYTGSGNIVVPEGVTQITVEAWGAGGGGGTRTNNGRGGGGGGGAYARSILTVSPGSSIPYIVGTGGTGSNNGGSSIFGSNVVVASGGSGAPQNSDNGAVGGTVEESFGQIRFRGGNGANSGGNFTGGGGGAAGADGNGGDSPGQNGGGGNGDNSGNGANGHNTNNTNGNPGFVYGGGGSGARRGGGTRIGGAGANGMIRISYVPAYRAEFVSMNTGAANWETGETRSISVTIKNTGQATWTDASPDINIGVKWNADPDYMVRTDAGGLAPGQTHTYELTVTAPMSIGTNNLTFDVVNEWACWFGNNNGVCGPGNFVFVSDPIMILPSGDKLYSYQSGDWNDPATWTNDPSGTLSINPAVPGAFNKVVILNGRDVYIPNNARSVYSLEIRKGGSLDIRNTTGHNLGLVSGKGTLRLRGDNFPNGDFDIFVAAEGGTIEYYDPAANFTLGQLVYNNLTFNFANTNRVAILAGNLRVNGKLLVNRGIFQVGNNNAGRTVEILEDVLVENQGRIQLGTGNANHRIIVGGDFTNYGVVRFTNQVNPNYTATPNNGRSDVVFNNPSRDQNLFLDGQSDFYRIEIDKGIDQTFVLHIDATDTQHFSLFGRNDQDPGTNAPNINNTHALGLLAGTVRLGENIVIPSLATGTTYTVDEDAMLWLDGANVTYGAGNTADGTTLLLYGNLKVSGSSVLNDNSKQGIVSRTTASIIIEGGEISTECIRTSYQEGVHRGAFNMSGGSLTIRAINLPNLGGMNVYAAFTLPYPDNTLAINGGEINILSSNPIGGGSGSNFSILIGANPNNVNITGGTFNVTVPNARNANVLSTAPFWDLNIISAVNNRLAQPMAYANNATIPGIAAQPLVVQNNLRLINRAVLTSGVNLDVIIGGDFVIENNATYTPANNTTVFNGNGPQTFTNNGTLTNGFRNLELANKSDLTLEGANTLAIRNDFILGKGTILRDNSRTITVAGNIENSGNHFRPVTGAGSIQLIGNANQRISGDGNGIFNNLTFNKNGGSVNLDAGIAINGELRMVNNHCFLIGNHTLKLGEAARIYSAATGTVQVFTQNKMIVTGGLMSDGGIQKQFSGTDVFLLPFGFQAANNTYYYLPAALRFSVAPAQWGKVTSKPINARHHLAQGANNALNVFWKTTSDGFDGVAPGSVVHAYTYNDYFVQGNENNYIPAVYGYGTAWRTINDVNQVNQVTNVISFNAENNAHGDYTAGLPAAFTEIPVLYSRNGGGNWNNTATWSNIAVNGPVATTTPSANTIVVIGDENNAHTVTMNINNAAAGALFVVDGSVLDLIRTNGHNFAALPEEVVSGSGTLRIARSNYFPRGDFGEFIGQNGGTVEYYTTTEAVVVPVASDGTGLPLISYKNLVLNASGQNITLPDTDVNVLGDLTVKGTGANMVQTRAAGTGRNYTIQGILNIESGNLQYQNGVAASIMVKQDVIVHNGAAFTVRNGNNVRENILEVWRSLYNEGDFNMQGGTRYASTYFKGENNAVIEGNGTTHFYNLFVDKGLDATPVLTLKSNITTGVTNPFLTLLNGTFRVDNEILTVTLTNGATSFHVPSTAALSVNAGNVRVAYGNGTGNLELSGKLEVLGGRMEIGQPGQNRNNSIEYAAAGRPQIFISAGELLVNGQIRRPATITSGALNYMQHGGLVSIAGRNRIANRALLEIANDGSLLEFSGGTLSLARPSANASTFGDVYLRPAQHQVNGGTLELGTADSGAGYDFSIQTSSPLWNFALGVGGNIQYATLAVLPLVVKNDLTILGNSEFKANQLNVTIGGGLINNNLSSARGVSVGGYQPGHRNQKTMFNGSASQFMQGAGLNVTNFGNLEIRTGGNLILENNSVICINNDLALLTGNFNDGGNHISVIRNINNIARHISPSDLGGISLEGDHNHTLSGNAGIYGNIIMNTSAGASMISNNTINGRLTFNDGSLYIDDYLLTFGEHASIGGNPDRKRMVMLNGVISDQGVRKLFGTGSSPEFIFPLGVQGKYTPASYIVTSNSAPGNINLRLVNQSHAAVTDAAINELNYYWSVKSTGFGAPQVTHTYTYVQDDVRGDESQYVGGRYDCDYYTWENLGNVVDPVSNTMSFTSPQISGEYTAGFASNFNTKPILYSRLSGNWSNGQTWSTTSHTGDACNCVPDGNPVIIAIEHVVFMSTDGAFTFSTEINGKLDMGASLFHNLGFLKGEGTLTVSSTSEGIFVLPGGNYDEFLDNPATIIEFTGNNAANLPLKPGNIYKPFQNVVFSGTGVKYVSAEDMKINGNLIIRNGATLSNSNFHRDISVGGDWINQNTTAGGFEPGRGRVIFEGTQSQQFSVVVPEQFYNLTMNSTSYLDMITSSAGMEIENRIELTKGIIKSFEGKEVVITNTSVNAAQGGSINSFVDGPLRKRINAGQRFAFPVGNDGRYGPVVLQNTTSATSPAYWTAVYHNENPYPRAEENFVTPITSVSDNEHWVITRPAAGSTNFNLRWDELSYPGITDNPQLRNSLRIVQYNLAAEQWSEKPTVVQGASKSVVTQSPVNAGDFIFTLGMSGVTATITNYDAVAVCDNGEIASIPVALTGTAPWTLTYQVLGPVNHTFTQSGISNPNYVIQLTGNDLGQAGSYQLSLVSVADQHMNGYANLSPVILNIQHTSKPVISGSILVGQGETRNYLTALNPGNTYAWSWVGANGGNIATPGANQTNITFSNGTGIYELQITETTTSTGCLANDVLAVEVINLPVPAILPVQPNLCEGNAISYSTLANTGNQYRWTIIGGTITTANAGNWRTVAQGGNSVNVVWDNPGAGILTVEERINISVSASTIQEVFVSSKPGNRNLVADYLNICDGGSTLITLNNSENGITYQLRIGETAVGAQQAGDGTGLTFSTGSLTNSGSFYDFNILAYNLGCQLEMADKPRVNILDASVALVSDYDDQNNIICPGTEVTFTVGSGNLLEILEVSFYVNSQLKQSGTTLQYINDQLQNNDLIELQAVVSGGCMVEKDFVNTVEILAGDGFWIGEYSNNWSNPANWSCGQVPSVTTDVIIPTKAISTLANIDFPQSPAFARNVQIQSGTFLQIVDATLNIHGDFVLDGQLLGNNHTLAFEGTTNQNMTGQDIVLHNLKVNKSLADVILVDPVTVNGLLDLQRGRINTSATSILNLGTIASTTGGNASSFINGPMQKAGESDFVFPVGKNNRWARVGISNISDMGTKSIMVFEAEYFNAAADNTDIYNLEGGLMLISELEYWEVNPIGKDAQAHITLFWEDAAYSAIQRPEELRVVQFRDNFWRNHGGVPNNIVENVSGNVSSTLDFTTFGQFTFGSLSSNNPFPIELLYFTALADEKSVDLIWATASETNNDYFTLERSECGTVFSPIAYLSSKAEFGNSAHTLQYTWKDMQPLLGVSYYRLKQTDFDGSFDYSAVAAVNMDHNMPKHFTLYPNPNKGDFFRLSAQPAINHQEVWVVGADVYGKVFFQQSFFTDDTGMLNITISPDGKLPAGVYFITVSSPGFSSTSRMVVQ